MTDRFWYRGFDVFIDDRYEGGREVTVSRGYTHDPVFDTIGEALEYINEYLAEEKTVKEQ